MNTYAARHRRTVICWGVLVCAVVLVSPALADDGNPFHGRLEVSTQGLCIHGIVFRKTIPLSGLQASLARIVDLDQEPNLRSWIKIYGIGLPSFHAGWFFLKDREKALLLVTDAKRAVYVPTCQGYALLLSPDRAEEFLASLQRPALDRQVFSLVTHKKER